MGLLLLALGSSDTSIRLRPTCHKGLPSLSPYPTLHLTDSASFVALGCTWAGSKRATLTTMMLGLMRACYPKLKRGSGYYSTQTYHAEAHTLGRASQLTTQLVACRMNQFPSGHGWT